jgi:hypothetical protein
MDIINHPLFTQLSPFISNVIILHYLYWLDKTKCQCALTPLKNKLQVGFIILCVGSIIQIYAQSMNYNNFVKSFGMVYMICSLYLSIYVIKYVHRLQQDNCNCSNDWKRSYMYFVNGFELVLFIGSILYVIVDSIK